MSMYAAILAGGSGTRLWPLSTKTLPKQFLRLVDDTTMLQQTVDRLLPLAPIEQTFVVTFEQYVTIVQDQLPDIPAGNIIAEPLGRGTAASIGLAATFIAAKDPHAVMGSFSADHIITHVEEFRSALSFAEEIAREGFLVTLGIEPTYPETGYGYIHAGERLQVDAHGHTAYKVIRFVEKPNYETAEQFLRTGEYAWNAGIFIWRVDRILEEIRRHVPTVSMVLDAVAAGLRQGNAAQAMIDAWKDLTESVTIDNGVMEHASNITVVPVDIGWNDIGNWASVATLHDNNEHLNSSRFTGEGRHVAIDTHNTFVYSTTHRTIATAGVKDLVIVDTGDSLLVCHKDQVQLVKNITDQLTAK